MKKKKRDKINYYCNHVYEVAKKIDSNVPRYGFIQENTASADLNEILTSLNKIMNEIKK